MEQAKFIEIVEELKNRAAINKGVISKKEIDDAFSDEDTYLDESQLGMVYAFLKTSKIEITDGDNALDIDISGNDNSASNEAAETGDETDKDSEFVKMYQSDLKCVVKLSPEELISAMKEPLKNKESIINTYLKDVVKWVRTYEGGSVFMSDLIQEGNIALMEAFSSFDFEAALLQEDPCRALTEHFRTKVKKAAMDALFEQDGENNVGYKVAGRVNAVNDCAKELSEDYGRKVTLDEIAEKLDMTYDEVKEITDLSANKIEYINYF
ncbi:MAG: sigma-70 domain-containing protein [Lachnospiraceae bacterium]